LRKQAGAEAAVVAHRAGPVEHLDHHVFEGLVAEGVRPPQPRVLDGDAPRHLVLAGGEGLFHAVLGVPDRRAQHDRRRLGGVERRAQRDHGALVAGFRAERDQPGDAHRPGVTDRHRAPDAARVPIRVETVPVLEDTGEVALRGPIRRAGAAHLDGEQVLAAGAEQGGHLEGVGKEIALGVADVGPVQPDVAQVEEAVEHEPAAPTGGRRGHVEGAAVEERTVLLGEVGGGPPMARDVEHGPAVVVQLGSRELPSQALVGRLGAPRA
jgi:hypothetical protein